MTVISPFSPDAGPTPPDTRAIDERNARDNWLRQVELAMIADLNCRNASIASGHDDQAQNTALDKSYPAIGSPSSIGMVAANTATYHRASASGQNDAAAPAPSTPTHAGAESNDTAIQAPKGDTYLTPLSQNDTTLAGVSNAIANAIGTTAVDQTMSREPGVVATSMDRLAAQAAYGFEQGAFTLIEPEAPNALPMPEQDVLSGDALGQAPDWQKHMMHIVRNGDDAQVWIRDSALNPATSASLVAKIAASLASAGVFMTTANINGKPVFRSFRTDQRDSLLQYDTEPPHDIESTPQAYPGKEHQHGT